MKFAMVYLLVSSLTHSPLLAGAALLAFWLAGGSWWVGRLPDLFGPWRRWQQERALRDLLATHPHDLNARTDLAGLVAERNPAEAKELLGTWALQVVDLEHGPDDGVELVGERLRQAGDAAGLDLHRQS